MRVQTRPINLGVIAHVDAGKTTVSERLLFLAGQIHRVGEVHDGQAHLDHLDQEKKRGITITAAAHSFYWDKQMINLIDTPGHVDFTAEVERCIRVLDGAVAVFDAVAGVEPQSETVWRQANRYRLPRIVFINKMDRPGADLAQTVSDINQQLGSTPVVLQVPLRENGELVGVIDVLSGNVWRWNEEATPDNYTLEVIPESMATPVARAQEQLISLVAERDDQLLECWADGSVSTDQVRSALRRLVASGEVVPVLCGSALAGVGLQPLLDAVVYFLYKKDTSITGTDPSNPEVAVVRGVGGDQPFSGLVFKVVHGQRGKLTWIRVYSGMLETATKVRNANTGTVSRVRRLLRLKAGELVDLDRAYSGDIAAVVGCSDAVTGHTLCAPDAPVIFESMDFPEPVMAVAVEPRTSADQAKLSTALARLTDEDPTFTVSTHSETGQTLVSGMGELHLQVVIENLRTTHGVEVITGQPEVAFRETIDRSVSGVVHKLVKQSGGPGMYANVTVDLEPTSQVEPGQLEFVNATSGGVVPDEFAKAVQVGATEALSCGPGGNPLVGVKLTLVDGSTHPNDSNDRAFRIAGGQVLRIAVEQAGVVKLEPIMAAEVVTPSDSLGSVLRLIAGRKGTVSSLEEIDQATQCKARIPLAELFGFSDALRSVSQGRASVVLTPDGYEPAG